DFGTGGPGQPTAVDARWGLGRGPNRRWGVGGGDGEGGDAVHIAHRRQAGMAGRDERSFECREPGGPVGGLQSRGHGHEVEAAAEPAGHVEVDRESAAARALVTGHDPAGDVGAAGDAVEVGEQGLPVPGSTVGGNVLFGHDDAQSPQVALGIEGPCAQLGCLARLPVPVHRVKPSTAWSTTASAMASAEVAPHFGTALTTVSLPRVVVFRSSMSSPSSFIACARTPRGPCSMDSASSSGTNLRTPSTKADLLTTVFTPRAAVFAVCAANFQNPLNRAVDPMSPRSNPRPSWASGPRATKVLGPRTSESSRPRMIEVSAKGASGSGTEPMMPRTASAPVVDAV